MGGTLMARGWGGAACTASLGTGVTFTLGMQPELRGCTHFTGVD